MRSKLTIPLCSILTGFYVVPLTPPNARAAFADVKTPGEEVLPEASGLSSVTGGTTKLGTWHPLANAPPIAAGVSLLLTDGTIVVLSIGTSVFWRLSPDLSGSYLNGTWSELPPMPNNYAPLAGASAVLPDGRLIVEGGEYDTYLGTRAESLVGAIYDPVSNAWTSVAPPPGYSCIGDASSVVLPDGRFLLATCWGTGDAVLDAKTLTWTTPFSSGKASNGHEDGWTLLQNGTVLTVDTLNFADLRASEILDPRTGRWSFAGDTPAQLSDLNINRPSWTHEIGPGVLRPDGTVWVVGASSHTAVYHPSGGWTAGPELPFVENEGQLGATDAPGTLLPDGHVLVAVNPGNYLTPVHMFDFDGATLTEVAAPPAAVTDTGADVNLLLLPSGEVLYTDQTNDVEIFTSTGRPLLSSAPTIDRGGVPTVLQPGGTYTLSGTQLNGLSQASMYGDDYQAATNYPLVRITNIATGHVFYARTHDHSTMAVAPRKPSSTSFDVSSSQEPGPSKLEVVANGVPSRPELVTITAKSSR